MKKNIVLLPGDGIGPEVTKATAAVLRGCAPQGGRGFSGCGGRTEVGFVAGRTPARKRAARPAQRAGTVRKRSADQDAGTAAGNFAPEGRAARRFGPGNCARTGGRNVFWSAWERDGKGN